MPTGKNAKVQLHAPRMACCSSSFAYFILTLILWFAAAASAPVYADPPLSEQGDWAPGGPGDVEVDALTNPVTLEEGESLTYQIRLTRPPLDDVNVENDEFNDGKWWVRIFVNGAVRADGVYPQGEREDGMITWVPSVGWEFNTSNYNQWRNVTIRCTKGYR